MPTRWPQSCCFTWSFPCSPTRRITSTADALSRATAWSGDDVTSRISVALSLVLCLSSPAMGQEPGHRPAPSLEDLEIADQMRESIDELEASFEKTWRLRKNHCQRAFGSNEFCSCLGDKLPAVVTFPVYAAVVISTREELGYAVASADERAVIDGIYAAREECVARLPRPDEDQ